jgi:hypothetical protein
LPVVASNIVMGPAIVYTAPFGTTEPAWSAITTSPASPWTDVGGTADGTSVLLEVETSVTDIMVEQNIDPVGARVSKRVIQVTVAIEEATQQNLLLAMNQMAVITTGSGYSVLDPLITPTSLQPQYTAIIIDGYAPTTGTLENACRRRLIVRKCLSTSKVDFEYEKTKPTIFQTTWTGYFISTLVPPFEVIDQTS